MALVTVRLHADTCIRKWSSWVGTDLHSNSEWDKHRWQTQVSQGSQVKTSLVEMEIPDKFFLQNNRSHILCHDHSSEHLCHLSSFHVATRIIFYTLLHLPRVLLSTSHFHKSTPSWIFPVPCLCVPCGIWPRWRSHVSKIPPNINNHNNKSFLCHFHVK